MPILTALPLLAALAAPSPGADADWNVCHAVSSYDLTVGPALTFERAGPAPQRVVMQDGRLHVDGAAPALNAEDRDRVALFERNVRSLVPQVKSLAERGADLAAQAVREQVAAISPQAAADPQFAARLAARTRELKARIAASTSTKDWQGEALDAYAQDVAADILPIVGADAGQQALDLAMQGDLSAAAALKDRAANLQPELEARIRARLQTLKPDARKLCPTLRELDQLESGLDARLPGGPLQLIEIAR